ncbi:hypothetical protein [Parendozoicomonas sp. Alg238-R29]|uniref:hypothetical protein n=1 Tax=Parendozoicomonas sp. Alg238-R29 TaxID=2993446 RepID=UPI00248E3CD7|nr:hypothetical protein [Parendozoicomonas sp. Alg238-R29]
MVFAVPKNSRTEEIARHLSLQKKDIAGSRVECFGKTVERSRGVIHSPASVSPEVLKPAKELLSVHVLENKKSEGRVSLETFIKDKSVMASSENTLTPSLGLN